MQEPAIVSIFTAGKVATVKIYGGWGAAYWNRAVIKDR